jgi:hypothetical protein
VSNSRKILSFVLLAAVVVGLTTAVGCANNNNNSSSPRRSQRGEACETTADCNDGLSCVPRTGGGGGVCVQGEFKVTPTAKECAVVQCAQASDCCQMLASATTCATYQTECNQGSTVACTDYQTYCQCHPEKYSCDNGTCRSVCTKDTDCGGTLKCSSGQCIQCSDDSQCTGGTVCTNSLCVAPCKSDTDCSSFNVCDGSGHCTAGGCQTDRECIAETKNVTALCKSNACVVPCQTDLECGNPQDYHFYSCIKNQCIYVGCDTDKECQLYLGAQGNGTTHGQIVCRDKQQ